MCDGMGMAPFQRERGRGVTWKLKISSRGPPLGVLGMIICYRVVCMGGCVFPHIRYRLSAASPELLSLGLFALEDQFFSSCAVNRLSCHMCT